MNNTRVVSLLAGVMGYIDGLGKTNKQLDHIRGQVQEAYDELTKQPEQPIFVPKGTEVVRPVPMPGKDDGQVDPLAARSFVKSDKKAFDAGVAGAIQVEDMSARVSPQTITAKVQK